MAWWLAVRERKHRVKDASQESDLNNWLVTFREAEIEEEEHEFTFEPDKSELVVEITNWDSQQIIRYTGKTFGNRSINLEVYRCNRNHRSA